MKSSSGHWHSLPVTPDARTTDGLVIYRFSSGLYFAHASRFAEDVTSLTGSAAAVRWFRLDSAAIGDVDYTAAAVLTRVHQRLHDAGIRLTLSKVIDPVRVQLDRYGLSSKLGAHGLYETSGEVLAEYGKGAPEN